MRDIIDSIVKDKIPCYFVSPHQDDAILSAGGLITYLSKKTKVSIINVFNGMGEKPYTLSTKAFFKQCGFLNSHSLEEQRCREDSYVADKLGINLFNLNFNDALLRKKDIKNKVFKYIGSLLPELLHVYPIYRIHIKNGKISVFDSILIKSFKDKIREIIKEKNAVVFCPCSLGGHIDHKIVKKVCIDLFKRLIYWADFPYNQELKNFINLKNLEYEASFRFMLCQYERYQLSKIYQSQNKAMCSEGKIRFTPERYFISPDFLRIGKGNKKKELRFEIVDKVDSGLEKEWTLLWDNSCNGNFFNSYDWFKICSETFLNEKIKILLCYKNTELYALLPLINRHRLGTEILLCPGDRHLDKFSLLIKEYERDVLRSFIDYILKNKHVLYLSEADDEIMAILMNRKNVRILNSSVSPYIPDTNDKLIFMNKKHRHKVENIIKENGNDIKFLEINENKTKFLDKVMDIERQSTRKNEGKGTFENKKDKKLFSIIFKNLDKYLYLIFLSFKNRLSAYRIGIGYKSTYYDLNTAYKNDVGALAPGKLLLYYALKYRLHESMRRVDMLRGDAQLKRDFTPYYENRYNIIIGNNKLIINILYIKDSFINYILNNKRLYNFYLIFKNIYRKYLYEN